MSTDDAIRKRILELVEENKTTITALCLNSNLTPSTVFDFMYGKIKYPKVITIKKLCAGANITLEQFFARDYFNSTEDVYWEENMEIKEILARIGYVRNKAGLSAREVSLRIGMSPQYVAQVESGRIVLTIEKLLQIL